MAIYDPFNPAHFAVVQEPLEYGQGSATTKVQMLAADGSGRAVIWDAQKGGQQAFFTKLIWEVLLEGNRGGGKTDVLLMDFFISVNKGFGRAWKGLLLRRTFPELRDVIDKSMIWFPRVCPGARYNQSTYTWHFPQGETLRFAYAQAPKDYYNYHGHAYPWIAWEELTTWPDDKLYKMFMSLNRSSRADMPRRYCATTNPFGVGHSWVKDRFRLPAMKGKVIKDSMTDDGKLERPRIAIHCDLFDNEVLMTAEPEYVTTLSMSADSPARQQAWVAGSWDIVAGGMFSDVWNPKVNVLPDFMPPKDWYIDKAYDDGSSAPFSVGWYAESNGEELVLPGGIVKQTIRGDLFRFKEWYGWNGKRNEGLGLTSSEISSGIIERELSWGIYGRARCGPADSAIFSNEHGINFSDEFKKPVQINGKWYRGQDWQKADKAPGSRKAGWRQIRAMLKQAQPIKGRRTKPGLFICEGCVQWLNTVPILPRSEKEPDDVEHPEDHAGDETRYRLHNPPQHWRQSRKAGE